MRSLSSSWAFFSGALLLLCRSNCEDCAAPPAQQLEIVLFLDASWSQSERTWSQSVAAANSFVDGLLTSSRVQHRISVGYFHRDAVDVILRSNDKLAIKNSIEALQLPDIRATNENGGPFYATDHPDALSRSEELLALGPDGRRKVVVMMTDGEPWKASARCREGGVPGAELVVELPCNSGENPCFEGGCQVDCLCAVHQAKEFRERGYELYIVGVPNDLEGHEGNFEGIMAAMASPGKFEVVESFDNLRAAVEEQLLSDVCEPDVCNQCEVNYDAAIQKYREAMKGISP